MMAIYVEFCFVSYTKASFYLIVATVRHKLIYVQSGTSPDMHLQQACTFLSLVYYTNIIRLGFNMLHTTTSAIIDQVCNYRILKE